MQYLLNTNVLIDYFNGRYPAVIEKLQALPSEDLCTSSIVAAELRYCADKSSRSQENHRRIDIALAEILCIPFDSAAATSYGTVRSQLEEQGRAIGPNDLMIAAHALSLGLVLVSDNEAEFRRVPGLRVDNWR